MKHKLIGGLAVTALIAFVGFSLALAASTSVTDYYQVGTRTYVFTMDSDSLDALGHYHYSSGALKTSWVPVPVGVDFMALVQCRDSDSSIWCGPDTLGVALETAPYHSIAHDSASGAYKYHKAQILWDYRSLVFHNWARGVSHWFPSGYADTTIDTIDIAATSLKSGLKKTPIGNRNLGMLRFSMCVDGADSVLDGLVRLNCFIVYKETQDPNYRTYGNLDRHDIELALSLVRCESPVWARAETPSRIVYAGTFRNEVR